ncbi:MAG TPA: ribonuclease III, partial [Dehalococcoidia bacterium]|nr:ribonuclease III [Dehalococcoidia bacterium]
MTRRLKSLQERLGIQVGDPQAIRRAFVHRSYINESRAAGDESNERLEFLGDAIVGYIVAEYLFDRFPQFTEGELSALRAALVRTETLARAGRRLRLGEYLLVGRSIDKSGGRQRPHLLACTFEALVAAIHADQGLEAARRVVLDALRPELDELITGESMREVVKSAKSRFQEEVLGRWHVTPTYRTVAAEGPDHARRYEAVVL